MILNPGGTIAVADLDPDNGESHGPEMIVHSGFDRRDLGEIFKKTDSPLFRPKLLQHFQK